MTFKTINSNYSIGLSEFQKHVEEFTEQILSGVGLPAALFGPDDSTMATYATYDKGIDWQTNFPTGPGLLACLRQAEAKLQAIHETDAIARRLPAWITVNRWELADHLWVAERVFDHNLAAIAELHRLPRRW